MNNCDIKNYPWVIFFNGESERLALVDWLQQKGYRYTPSFEGDVLFTNVPTYSDRLSSFPLRTSGKDGYNKEICKEIKPIFKTVVDSVIYPVLESENDKKIRELKETIEKAQKQIEDLQNSK